MGKLAGWAASAAHGGDAQERVRGGSTGKDGQQRSTSGRRVYYAIAAQPQGWWLEVASREVWVGARCKVQQQGRRINQMGTNGLQNQLQGRAVLIAGVMSQASGSRVKTGEQGLGSPWWGCGMQVTNIGLGWGGLAGGACRLCGRAQENAGAVGGPAKAWKMPAVSEEVLWMSATLAAAAT